MTEAFCAAQALRWLTSDGGHYPCLFFKPVSAVPSNLREHAETLRSAALCLRTWTATLTLANSARTLLLAADSGKAQRSLARAKRWADRFEREGPAPEPLLPEPEPLLPAPAPATFRACYDALRRKDRSSNHRRMTACCARARGGGACPPLEGPLPAAAVASVEAWRAAEGEPLARLCHRALEDLRRLSAVGAREEPGTAAAREQLAGLSMHALAFVACAGPRVARCGRAAEGLLAAWLQDLYARAQRFAAPPRRRVVYGWLTPRKMTRLGELDLDDAAVDAFASSAVPLPALVADALAGARR